MTIPALFFWIFATMTVGAALMVVSARNPVHAVLFLIVAFVNAAGLFLLLGAEFLAMILVIVYVGAVAVLFLFVVMMLDVDFTALRQGFWRYLPIGALVGLIVAVELALVGGHWALTGAALGRVASPVAPGVTNVEALGRVLYTHYVFVFEGAGFVLLTAMIGAIVLTLRHRPGVRRQDIAAQNARTPGDAVVLHDVPPGTGLREG